MHEPRTGCTCTDWQGLGWVFPFLTFVIPNSSCLHPILKGQQNWAATFTSLLKNFSCFCKHFASHTHLCFTSTLTLLENGLTGLWMSLVIFPGVNRQEIEKASLNVRKSERYIALPMYAAIAYHTRMPIVCLVPMLLHTVY